MSRKMSELKKDEVSKKFRITTNIMNYTEVLPGGNNGQRHVQNCSREV